MKKNLLAIIILALLLVNTVLTGMMMFSNYSQTQKTTQLINKIAEAVDLELVTETEEGMTESVSIADTDVFVTDSMTIPLADSGDGRDHYFIVTVSLSMNMKHEDYPTYAGGEGGLTAKASLIKSEISSVIGKYTLEYVKANQADLRQEILERLQEMYHSDFIYDVTFSDPLYS